jgi:hypothetical protein
MSGFSDSGTVPSVSRRHWSIQKAPWPAAAIAGFAEGFQSSFQSSAVYFRISDASGR